MTQRAPGHRHDPHFQRNTKQPQTLQPCGLWSFCVSLTSFFIVLNIFCLTVLVLQCCASLWMVCVSESLFVSLPARFASVCSCSALFYVPLRTCYGLCIFVVTCVILCCFVSGIFCRWGPGAPWPLGPWVLKQENELHFWFPHYKVSGFYESVYGLMPEKGF